MLFGENGFHQTSMSELAAEADMSVGLIYRAFKSKDEIIEAIVSADFDRKLTEFENLRERLRDEALTVRQTFEELFQRTIEENREALAFDILAEGFRNARVGKIIDESCQRFRDYFRAFIRTANNRLSDEEVEGAAELALCCLLGLAHRNISRPKLGAAQTARQSALMITMALEGI
ncbi:TetR/AcrR family transcriptional repressor of uid operon [Croceicoccus naphthovorans]|nr:TetR/AcrR family transcriptional regulator [Croceicoccus naphthovorans]MBB3992154.1 TetR/AcrR family transcriptional repressor of uid operon [Croceicoccus naphthovorans]